ncbi:MAG: response regulator [Bacteroidetes bacterium]|nr:MAG: response regulator [Bacteroidota bacterium]
MKQQLLVVDDSEMMRSFLAHYFGKHYLVHTVGHASQAWQWLDDGHFPSVILLDLRLPQISGYELLCQLKSSVLFNEIPVIMLSSVNKSQERVRCLQAGAADYVLKPFNPKELELRLQYHARLQNA